MKTKDYESTVMRIAGNLLSGVPYKRDNTGLIDLEYEDLIVEMAVRRARAIVAEVKRTEQAVNS